MGHESIKVGMSDWKIAKAPDELTTLGLGSCVGVIIYDRTKKIAGLIHAMLPSSKEISNNENRAKFVDTGIEDLVDELVINGANKNTLVAKIAGGAKMFNFSSDSDILRIGERNVTSAKDKLKEMGIRIIAEDTGGNFGRTIIFNPDDSSLHIRTIGHGEKTI